MCVCVCVCMYIYAKPIRTKIKFAEIRRVKEMRAHDVMDNLHNRWTSGQHPVPPDCTSTKSSRRSLEFHLNQSCPGHEGKSVPLWESNSCRPARSPLQSSSSSSSICTRRIVYAHRLFA
jgi:hypothetical protein